jgi:hypothetical protein
MIRPPEIRTPLYEKLDSIDRRNARLRFDPHPRGDGTPASRDDPGQQDEMFTEASVTNASGVPISYRLPAPSSQLPATSGRLLKRMHFLMSWKLVAGRW